MLCKHCGRLKIKDRGLCYRCCKIESLRKAYPPCTGWVPGKGEPTMEELDQIIHEQMKCLPSWWRSESENENRIRLPGKEEKE